jgi:hypothetical protein
MKKLLIIVEDIGVTAPGIVFERLIIELMKKSEVDVFCVNNLSLDLAECSKINSINCFFVKSKLINMLSRLLMRFFSFDLMSMLIALFLRKKINKTITIKHKYDGLIAFVSHSHYSSLLVAENIKKNIVGAKYLAYFVDAIPAPIGWIKENENIKLKNFIINRLRNVDILCSSNEMMLKYQLSMIDPNRLPKSGVLYNPSITQQVDLPHCDNLKKVFLYTGSIYGPRKVSYLFLALKKILSIRDDVYIVFVGSNIPVDQFNLLSNSEKTHVICHDFTENLIGFYENSIALLDINSDLIDDIYLSSKVIGYLGVNRLIISESVDNSPPAILFSNIPSILRCDHNPDSIFNCMTYAIEVSGAVDFSDRKKLLQLVSGESVSNKLLSFLV